ncbi:MAG: hypothetical protein IMZ58_07295 [Thermoplasmata archaeon]|nr:hypothetical protein [Thermoplasmata archaeon]
MTLEYITIAYGIALLAASVWFFFKFHRPNYKSFPTITTLVIWVSVLPMLYLIGNNQLIQSLFGTDAQAARDNIFLILGQLFIGFILIITISWGLMQRGEKGNIADTVYAQCYFLVGLFFFLVLSFMNILLGL